MKAAEGRGFRPTAVDTKSNYIDRDVILAKIGPKPRPIALGSRPYAVRGFG